MIPTLRGLAEGLLDLLAPLRCPVCDRKLARPARCPECRLPRRGGAWRELHGDRAGPYLLLSGGAFRGRLRRVVLAGKYRGDPGALALLVAQARGALGGLGGWDALVPVPSHPVRVRERGGAPAEALARGLGRALGLPVVRCLRRSRYTPPLTGRSARERRALLADAIHARAAAGCLLLVDDVVTTTATYRACRRALLAAGATAVDLLAAARTPPRHGR